jgi:vesicle coat complex subunit
MSKLPSNEALRLCKATSDIDVIIDLTHHPNPQVRQRALREMCPCRVKTDIDDFWMRVFEMTDDPAENVRYQVLHTMCDGSPAHLESQVAEGLDHFNRDPDKKIRRQAHKALTAYRRTGKWNIL